MPTVPGTRLRVPTEDLNRLQSRPGQVASRPCPRVGGKFLKDEVSRHEIIHWAEGTAASDSSSTQITVTGDHF